MKHVWVLYEQGYRASSGGHVIGVYTSLEAIMDAHPEYGLFTAHLVGGVAVAKTKDDREVKRAFRVPLTEFNEHADRHSDNPSD